jgi:hypothetical protein
MSRNFTSPFIGRHNIRLFPAGHLLVPTVEISSIRFFSGDANLTNVCEIGSLIEKAQNADDLDESASLLQQAAHGILTQQVAIPDKDSTLETTGRNELCFKLVDALLEHQDMRIAEFNSNEANQTRANLVSIRRAVEQARSLLGQIDPSLDERVTPLSNTGYMNSVSRNSKPNVGVLEQEKAAVRHTVTDLPLTERCNAVLVAFAKFSRSVHVLNRIAISSKQLPFRSNPQNAQHLLELMEHGYQTRLQQQTATKRARPTVESYNHVLEAWAYSDEPFRGLSAERVFQKIEGYGRKPDGDSYRMILRAWALSRERRSAFTATGHLRKMMRQMYLVEGGDKEFEPSYEDYRMVMKAYETAE